MSLNSEKTFGTHSMLYIECNDGNSQQALDRMHPINFWDKNNTKLTLKNHIPVTEEFIL